MDQAGRFTAEHSVMEAGIEIRELKHKLELAKDKIQKLELEIAELKNNGFDRDLMRRLGFNLENTNKPNNWVLVNKENLDMKKLPQICF